ncbi:hypothetical protein DFH08DRAFT_972107 [Mycena albidolilacea]|uniref:Uncharacterized protein n=1 Tax=Mycena albidolilacea TaxID=1033008 RepID=A0AAD6ZBW6_9AGAR|nr:hypothetical protein DFH08DRAFT_972107 [Mycena albidolilacea]
MTLSSVIPPLALVACAFFVTNVLFVVDRATASTKSGVLSTIISTVQMLASPESVEFNSFKEVAGIAGIYLASSAVLVLALEDILAIPSKPAFRGLFLLFQVGNAVYAAANAETLVAMGRTVMGFAALGMCVSASLAVGQIPHLFEQPRLLACLAAVVGIMVFAGPLIDERLLDMISTRQHGDTVLAKWCFCASLPIQIVVFAAWQPSSDAVILKFNMFPLFTDALSLATIVLGAFAIYRKLANRKVSDSESQVPRPRSGQIIFTIALLLLTGVYYLPLWFRASGRSESLTGLIIPPFMGSIFISLIGLTSLKNPFEIVPLAVAVITPLAFTIAFYRASGQLPACSFIGMRIICKPSYFYFPLSNISADLRRMLFSDGTSIGAGIRYSSLMGQATEFLDTINGVVDASRM